MYYQQIKNWFDVFSKDQILILNTENLSVNPHQTLKQIFNFLNLPNEKIQNIQNRKIGNYQKMNENTREYLKKLFQPHNEKLFKILGR